jgi:FAD/FMN-containing dehydrogenase
MPDFLVRLSALLGSAGLLTDPADIAPHCLDWRGLIQGTALAVARPADTAQVSATLRLCADAGVSVIPQGGQTSMAAGATPAPTGQNLVLSLSRMNRVLDVDPLDLTITAQAGVTLKAAQNAAAEAGCLLPLSISSEGSATIGGVLATNAGGNNTLRYGNARDQLLGLEAVLADGSVLPVLRRLRKDNTGYALRQLISGSEGTLAVITAAVLKLEPRPAQAETAFLALSNTESALALLRRVRATDPAALVAFEWISGAAMALLLQLIPELRLPVQPAHSYLLLELATPRPGTDLRPALESLLADALDSHRATDAALAESLAQRAAFWRLREDLAEAQKRAGMSIKNDVSVPVSRTVTLIEQATAACAEVLDRVVIAPFGHLGDGNIHFNLVQVPGDDPAAFNQAAHALVEAVDHVVRSLDGSFSAEHGIGAIKRAQLAEWRGGTELATMRRIKQALDPANLLNPGKLFPDA